MSNLRICIIGSSIAGISAAAAAHRENPQAEIHIFTEDTHLPYYRQRLAEVLLDPAAASRLLIHPAEWYKEHGETPSPRNPRVSASPTAARSATTN